MYMKLCAIVTSSVWGRAGNYVPVPNLHIVLHRAIFQLSIPSILIGKPLDKQEMMFFGFIPSTLVHRATCDLDQEQAFSLLLVPGHSI